MNTKRLLDKILNKWPAKVVCLVIAIFLYFFHQASMIDSKTFVVPLQIIEDGMVMPVGNTPGSVSVVVRAGEEVIKAVLPSDISASVSLDSITSKGTYKLPVKITLSESLMEYDPFEVKLKDDSVSIEVDRKATKYVPVLPSTVGEVAHGYEIEKITMNPSTVEIYGPESVVNATEAIYSTRVNVSNAEINFSADTDCQQPNKLITFLDEGPFVEGDITDLVFIGQHLDFSFRVDEIDALFDCRDVDGPHGVGTVAELDESGRVILGDKLDTVEQILLQVFTTLVLDDILCKGAVAAGQEQEGDEYSFHGNHSFILLRASYQKTHQFTNKEGDSFGPPSL